MPVYPGTPDARVPDVRVGRVMREIAGAATFTRPNDITAYASGDLVANNVTAGSVVPITFNVGRVFHGYSRVTRARLTKTTASITNASFRLHLFSASPAVANGDNGALVPTLIAPYLGALDFTFALGFSNGSVANGIPVVGSEVNVFLTGNYALYGLLEARGAYTPGAQEIFGASIELQLD